MKKCLKQLTAAAILFAMVFTLLLPASQVRAQELQTDEITEASETEVPASEDLTETGEIAGGDEAAEAEDSNELPLENNASPSLSIEAHVQDVGWMNAVSDGETAGTTGRSLRVEALKISLIIPSGSSFSGGISYRAHVQNVGWQGWVSDGETAGTTGRSLQMEALQVKLTGDAADYYDIYYRVHVADVGWMDWAKNGESAGTEGYALRLEAVEFRLVTKGEAAPGNTQTPFSKVSLSYRTHVQNVGWQNWVSTGQTAGTTGQSLRLEAINITISSVLSGSIVYSTHVQDIGWQSAVSNGAMSGTSGQSKRLEAIRISLTGNLASHFDIYYRVHAQNIGWMGWAKNGESAGTEGYSYRLEAIEICLVSKGAAAPGTTADAFRKYTAPAPSNPANTGHKVIYLTFDDGPGPYTEKLLNVLDKYNVKATFFVTAAYPKYQNMIAEEAKRGHTVAIHTYTHDYAKIYASDSAYIADMNKMNEVIKAQTGSYSKYFRFPGGSSNTVSRKYNTGIMTRLTKTLTAQGYRYYDWNVSSGDAGETTSTAQVVKNVTSGIAKHDVSVVLQHDVKSYSVDAVEQIIKWGLANGYTFRAIDSSTPVTHHSVNN